MKKENTNPATDLPEKDVPLFKLDLAPALNFELDFDISDFQVVNPEESLIDRSEPQENVRILRPRTDLMKHAVMYENAEAFADQIDLTPGSRTFAWISGSFILGDVVEALITRRLVGIKKLYVASLSINQDNIDSLKNVMLIMGDELEKLVMVLSGFVYSRHKYDIISYLYNELDDDANRVQIVFGRYHAKVICIETVHGHTITIHGSANLPSSSCIEQIMIEVDDRELYDFNVALMEQAAAYFGTINHKASRYKLKYTNSKEVWEQHVTAIQSTDRRNEAWQAEAPEPEAVEEAEAEAVCWAEEEAIHPRNRGESGKTTPLSAGPPGEVPVEGCQPSRADG